MDETEMKLIETTTSGWRHALRGMRRPGGAQSDTIFDLEGQIAEWGTTDIKRARNLTNQETNSGHPNFLSGIRVHLTWYAPHNVWNQIQRYHWVDIISSDSKMYTLTKRPVRDRCTPYVILDTVFMVQHLIDMYNSVKKDEEVSEVLNTYFCNNDLAGSPLTPQTKREFFQFIVENVPLGYQLGAEVSTNYLQVRTMYEQREKHRLSHWNDDFVKWVRSLPHSWLITGEEV